MGKQIRLNQEYSKTDKELLKDLHIAANKYDIYENHKLLYIYRLNTDSPYEDFEAFFGKEKNKFEIGLGNHFGIIGFDHRAPKPSLPIPVTVMKRSITDYVSHPQNVVAILMKKNSSKFYDTVIGCVSRGIQFNELPNTVQRKISSELFPVIKF